MRKHYLFVIAFLFAIIAKVDAQVCFGDAVKFNEGWRFELQDDYAAKNMSFKDNKWRDVLLPHDWSVEFPMAATNASCQGYLPGGIGWYRKHFTLTNDMPYQYIYFEGVYNRSEVYLNGHLLGKRPNGFISFMYDMTPYLNPNGENVLAVRVDHSRAADSRWYTGSGIYRDVWLVSAPEVHIAQWGVTYRAEKFTGNSVEVAVDVEIDNKKGLNDKLDIEASLVDKSGKVVATAKSKAQSGVKGISMNNLKFKVSNVNRWSLENPYLYTLKVNLKRNGKLVDKTSVSAGLRELAFDANTGFALNGKSVKVKGVCLHHDAGVLGAVVPYDVWKRRLQNIKGIGANAIRMSHNPHSPAVYQLCDELGLLVMDEAFDEWEYPKRKWLSGWNVGTPAFEGTFDFFHEWAERDVADMVRRDRNHPSVFLWSIGNEVDYPNDPYSHPVLDGSSITQPMYGGFDENAPHASDIGRIGKRLANVVRSIDGSRPVTGALAGVVMSNETEYPAALDVVGYNYTEGRYIEDHAKYPNRIIYGSETHSSFAAWKHVRDKEFIFGQFIWTGTDYLGESGRWPSRGLHTGLLDYCSFNKPRGEFRASIWCDTPRSYIGTYPQNDRVSVDAFDVWNYEDGQKIRVVCYTNSPQARLLLNGKVVGEMKPYDEETGVIYWDIPYKAGELKVEGCDKSGKVESNYFIKSSGRPYSLRATVDKTTLSTDRAVAHIVVELLDENGVLVKLADNEVTCKVEGAARLLGLDSGSNTNTENYRDNKHRIYQGRLLTYIETIGKEGEIKITYSSPLIKGCEVVIKAE